MEVHSPRRPQWSYSSWSFITSPSTWADGSAASHVLQATSCHVPHCLLPGVDFRGLREERRDCTSLRPFSLNKIFNQAFLKIEQLESELDIALPVCTRRPASLYNHYMKKSVLTVNFCRDGTVSFLEKLRILVCIYLCIQGTGGSQEVVEFDVYFSVWTKRDWTKGPEHDSVTRKIFQIDMSKQVPVTAI